MEIRNWKRLLLILLVFVSNNISAQLLYTQSPKRIGEITLNRNEIITKGNEILNSYVLLTVTDKKVLDVTNDKHDYVSMASYWWPDPDKKDGLPYIPKDGKYNPEIYKRHTDYKEMADLSKIIKSLGEAYYVSGDLKYVKEAEKYLKIWFIDEETRMNPNLNHAQFIRGHNKGRIEGIIDTRILIDLIEGIDFLNYKRQLSKNIHEDVRTWFSDFLNWMETSPLGKKGFSLKNNIATSFHLQRMVYNTFIGRTQVALNIYTNEVNSLFEKQIGLDGEQLLELKRSDPSGYSKANLGYLDESLVFVENLKGANEGNVGQHKEKIKKAQNYIDNRFK